MQTKLDKKVLIFVDPNDFNRQFRALRKYCWKQHKYLNEIFLRTEIFNKPIGHHLEYIPSDRKFEKVHGKIYLEYEVLEKVILIIEIMPKKLLIDGFMRELEVYKGIPYRTAKEKRKIELVCRLEEANADR